MPRPPSRRLHQVRCVRRIPRKAWPCTRTTRKRSTTLIDDAETVIFAVCVWWFMVKAVERGRPGPGTLASPTFCSCSLHCGNAAAISLLSLAQRISSSLQRDVARAISGRMQPVDHQDQVAPDSRHRHVTSPEVTTVFAPFFLLCLFALFHRGLRSHCIRFCAPLPRP